MKSIGEKLITATIKVGVNATSCACMLFNSEPKRPEKLK